MRGSAVRGFLWPGGAGGTDVSGSLRDGFMAWSGPGAGEGSMSARAGGPRAGRRRRRQGAGWVGFRARARRVFPPARRLGALVTVPPLLASGLAPVAGIVAGFPAEAAAGTAVIAPARKAVLSRPAL